MLESSGLLSRPQARRVLGGKGSPWSPRVLCQREFNVFSRGCMC